MLLYCGRLGNSQVTYVRSLLRATQQNTRRNLDCVQCDGVYKGKDNGNPRMRHFML